MGCVGWILFIMLMIAVSDAENFNVDMSAVWTIMIFLALYLVFFNDKEE